MTAVLRDSNKPHGLLNMTDVSKEPSILVRFRRRLSPGEGYRMIWRMMKRGTVEVEIEMKNSFSDNRWKFTTPSRRFAEVGSPRKS